MVTLNQVIAFEETGMTQEAEVKMMQEMINSGQAWTMPGCYGRTAMEYINAGLCMLGVVGHRDYYGNYVPSRTEVKPGTKGSAEYCRIMREKNGG